MTLLAPPPKPQPPQVAQPPRRVTPEELLLTPDNGSMELVNGLIVEKNVSRTSSFVEGNAATLFKNSPGAGGVALVYPQSMGYQCFADAPEKVRKPDVTVVRRDRVEALGREDSGYMPIVPDLAVEVISPNDVHYAVTEKIREYHAAGFPLVWVLDPSTQTLVVYPNGGDVTLLNAGDEATCESVLPDFRCKVADFFAGL